MMHAGAMIVGSPKSLLASPMETGTDRLLRQYVAENGYRLSLKTGLKDVLGLDLNMMSPRERDYWFTAHLDFVVFDAETAIPVLAVEYDGRHHLTDPRQMQRDALKDRLCEAADLPLLRIDSQFMRTVGRYQVLLYVLRNHDLARAFYEAQEQGSIPWDEPFIHSNFLTYDEGGCLQFDAMDNDALIYLCQARGRLGARSHCGWLADTDGGQVRARSLMCLRNDLSLFAECAVRSYRFGGVSAFDLAQELCNVEMAALCRRYEAGEAVAIGPRERDRTVQESQSGRNTGGWAWTAS